MKNFIIIIMIIASLFTGYLISKENSDTVFKYKQNITCDCYCRQDEILLPSHSKFNIDDFNINGYDLIRLYGNSMQPIFYEDNYAIVKYINNNYKLKSGELVYYTLKNKTDCEVNTIYFDTNIDINVSIIHRIEAIYPGDIIYTKGDNSHNRDIIKRCQIHGIVVGILYK